MKKPVLVLGGGIAGIQASLDLAESGVPVFLVEESPSIGGRMSQLDKTFPTNDCSACILAPKVTACYNHPLVRTFTYARLVNIAGKAGNFTATVERRPRFIDEEKCKGCGDCTAVCPISVKSEFDMGIGQRKAIYKPFAQAVPNKAVIDKKGTSPCKYNCPARLDAHGYVALTGEGRYAEALEVVRRTTPFAGVLGRICLHNCESSCSRRTVDESVSIAALKRFVADREIIEGRKPEMKVGPAREEKIAVIGAGPAGLNCAYTLAREGFGVTVFEALEKGGGMLRVGIPDYRLDKSILQYEIDLVASMGVEIRYNTPVGSGLTLGDLKEQGYRAVFIAIGAHADMKLGIPGEDADCVISSVRFLRELNLGRAVAPSKGSRVLIVGGGNVAMDAARSAVRLGCDVTVVYRRTRAEMPANDWEIGHVMEEGVRFEFLHAPVRICTQGGKVTGLLCERNTLGEPDASGRRRPVAVKGSEYVIPADYILPAIGQTPETKALSEAGFRGFDQKGRVGAGDNMATVIDGVFAGGDCRLGPATAVEAVAEGNRAARAIIHYIDGVSLPIEPPMIPQTRLEDINFEGARPNPRASMPMLAPERRVRGFEEVELGLDETAAVAEARRCVDCSICCDCRMCEGACKADAIDHCQQGDTLTLDVASVIMATGFSPSQGIPDGYGYGVLPDVVTAMEYERILSASGPYGGHVARPSDRRPPGRIAFLQCVGSRDCMCDAEYCSSVCCMYAVKEAMITREHLPSVKDIDIYYMDIRAYGKDFDRYIDSARKKYGIRFIPARVSDVKTNESGGLRLSYARQTGSRDFADYDMIVLSVGLSPKPENKEFAAGIGLKTDRYGFVWVNENDPPQTSIPGIFACGASSGPKDIPETVMEASAAAGEAVSIANVSGDGGAEAEKWFAQEPDVPIRDVSKEPVRMGVFICHCGVNIGGYVDVPEVVAYARTLPFVTYAADNLYTCSVDAQKSIIEKIGEQQLNRVVVASCTPRTHEPLFQ
ncbi:MAG: FAD-dependent oxidoreductase, partial [Clostridia bacterium]|nr:FAD-dependent oxidoreductase [Clostridia bacterium]